MKLRSWGAAVLAGVLFLSPLPGRAASAAGLPDTTSAARAANTAGCHPATPSQAPPTTSYYDPDRTYLGPEPLPPSAPVAPLLVSYHRFGALSADAFVAKYRSDVGWLYPPNDGFLTIGGHTVRYPQTMVPGSRIDRFGYPGGSYLAPTDTLFLQRALPPQNLNTPSNTTQSNYHLYCVLRAFKVEAGPIAPWFEQLGLGLQYKLDSDYLPAAGTALSVTWLLDNGYLVEEDPA